MSKMHELELIIRKIKNNADEIINNIKYESIDVYNFLQVEYNKKDVTKNYLFQFVFYKFYNLSEAKLPDEFLYEYYKIMQELKSNDLSLTDILNRLYDIKTLKGQSKLQFSFVTKMLHTRDPENVIYDSKVEKMFNYSYINNNVGIDTKIKMLEGRLSTISQCYTKIINNNLLEDVCNKFDDRFLDNGLHEKKRLDFIFWSAGKILFKDVADKED